MIGVVVLNYKTWNKTIKCLESLVSLNDSRLKIVVVDNCSDNDSFVQINNYLKENNLFEISLIKTEYNGGFSFGNNFGFDYLMSNYHDLDKVIFTNNDIVFQPGSIDAMIDAFSTPDIAVAGPKIENLDGTSNMPWKEKQSYRQVLDLENESKSLANWDEIKENTPVYKVHGSCFAISVSVFFEIGKFDSNVFLYNEENILSYKLKQKGYTTIAVPSSHVLHDHGATTGTRNIYVDTKTLLSTLYYWGTYENISALSLCFMQKFLCFKILVKKMLGIYGKNDKGLRECFKRSKKRRKDIVKNRKNKH